jgi:gliding motility-associated-like protein
MKVAITIFSRSNYSDFINSSMSKRLLLLASSLLSLIIPAGKTFAQTDANLFKLPDTVCNGHDIVPFNIIQTAQNYFWTFCPPNLASEPEGNNIGPVTSMNNTNGFILAEDDGFNYSFHINSGGGLARMKYANGLNGLPSMITGLGNNVTNPGGLYLANDGRWHLFVVAGTDSTNSRLLRYDFNEHGLKSAPAEVELGNLGGGLNGPKKLYLAKEGNNWYGFTFTKKDELIRLAFGADLLSTPTLTNLGNIDNHFGGISGITGIVELDNWHLFVTNRTKNTVNRISFGNSLANTPFVVDLGNLNNRVVAPVGITVTKDCDAYYAYVLNFGTASLITLRWDDQSIANVPAVTNHGNVAGFAQPLTLTGIVRDSGAVFMMATNNNDNSVSKIIFNSCDNATPAYSDLRLPPSFQIDEPGLYTVFLTINEGLPNVQTDCEQVYVYDHTPLTVSNDTVMCQNDTIRLSALSFGADSFKWAPNYNIDTTSGQFVDIWPTVTTQYTVTTYYDYNCIVKTPVNVKVSKIVADAGPDRIISDGSSSIVGGAGTTRGPQYTYQWTPDIGFTGSRDSAVTRVRPPYDITYYLNIVDTHGCRTIDSVLVSVPCDEINMPNAFNPASGYANTNKFGLLNQQLVKVNYFKVFDRWGKEVFTTTDPQGKWDGNVEGKEAPMGVYIWEVDANCGNTQQRFRRNGTVTLIR